MSTISLRQSFRNLLQQYPSVERVGFIGMDMDTVTRKGAIKVFASDYRSHEIAVLCDELSKMYSFDNDSEISAFSLSSLSTRSTYDHEYLKGVDW